MTGRDGVTVDILVQSPLWQRVPEAETTVRRAVCAAAGHLSASRPSTSAGEVAIVLTDDSAIRALNRDWRGADKPTNVLSFPAARTATGTGAKTDSETGAPAMLGDIVIAYETVARESTDDGKDFQHHLAHLAVHGFLHLIGYDHGDDGEAEDMERLEIEILAGLGIPDPYFARDLDRA